MQILYKKAEGEIFNPCVCANLTEEEESLIQAGTWGLLTVEDVATQEHIKRGHCKVHDGQVVMLPEGAWPENQQEDLEV